MLYQLVDRVGAETEGQPPRTLGSILCQSGNVYFGESQRLSDLDVWRVRIAIWSSAQALALESDKAKSNSGERSADPCLGRPWPRALSRASLREEGI